MKLWRGILELNVAVEAETEEEAQRLLAMQASQHEWTIWVEKDDA